MTASKGSDASPTRAIVGDTVWSAVAEASKLISSIVTFLFVARALGATPFGLLAGIAALVNMVSPFAGLGAPLLMLQRIRHEDQPLDVAFATAVTMTVLGGAAAVLVVTVLGSMVIPQASIAVVIILAVGDFLFGGVLQLCSGVAIAASQMRWYTLVVALPNVTRLAAAALFVALDHPSILLWAGLQLAVLGVTVVVVVSLLCVRFGIRFSHGPVAKRDLVDGLPYSASVAAFSAQDGLDKPLMVRYGWGVDAGYYAAAYRIPSLAFMPVQALIIATLNRTFSAGRAGVGAALTLAKRMMIPALVYSLAIALIIVTCAPLFGPLLGDSFEGAILIVRWLAFLPVLRTLQYFPANALTGAGRQRLRLVILLVTLAVNLVACLMLIPHWSWRGALAATFIAETLYAVMLWASALRLAALERKASPLPALEAST